MKSILWLGAFVAIVVAFYALAIVLVGFEGAVALAIHFGRVSLAVAVLIFYAPALVTIFRVWPAPRRDYLLAGILLTWASAACFALWNAMGMQFGVQTSIFVSPIAGFFSLLLVLGGLFHLLAPAPVGSNRLLIVALSVGVVAGLLIAVVAPLVLGGVPRVIIIPEDGGGTP